MIENLHSMIQELLYSFGMPAWVVRLSILFSVLVIVWFFYEIIIRLILPLFKFLISKWQKNWVIVLFTDKVVRRFALIPPLVLAIALLERVSVEGSLLANFLIKVAVISNIIAILMLFSSFSEAMLDIAKTVDKLKGKSFKGVQQVFQILLFVVGIVLVIAIIVDESPMSLLAGLGASAAVLMLVFKDTILGFVAGVQLSANNMLKVGDWITVPKYCADGDVIEITLNTVKVRNFDNTVTMVPPYVLVSDSFQNWEAMIESKGRRVTRSVNIDLIKVKFCTPEMVASWKTIPQLDRFMNTQESIDFSNTTNLTMLRHYLIYYLHHHEEVNQNQMIMVRQLPIGCDGAPLELYFFTNRTDWVGHEEVLSDLMEHMFAIVPVFGLNIYERASATVNDK